MASDIFKSVGPTLCIWWNMPENIFWNKVGVLGTSLHKTPTALSPLTHEGTKRTPWNKTTGRIYSDMGGRFGNTCLVHAKSERGVIGKIGVGFFGKWENIRIWLFHEKTLCQACHIQAKNTQERCLIYDRLGIVTVQNCAKLISKSITLHKSLAH